MSLKSDQLELDFKIQVVMVYQFQYMALYHSQARRKLENMGNRVKSRKFGHTFANRGNPDETAPYEPSHQDFHCLLSCFFFFSFQ